MSETRRTRRPPAGGYARGEETRQRIVEAAMKLFGEHGFVGASTRDIATAAGVNAPALQYYFENKAGVYQACAEQITNDLRSQFDPAMRQANAALKHADDVAALIEAVLAIQAVAIDCLLLQPQASNRHRFMARELASQEPGPAFTLLHRRLKQPLNKLSIALLARIGGTAPQAAITRIRLLSLRSQLMPFRFTQEAALELLGWKDIDAGKAALVKQVVLSHSQVLLESWYASAAKPMQTA